MLEGQLYLDTKTKDIREEKWEANIPDEHRGKNPPLNISKPNSAIHKKDYIPWSSGIYSRDPRMFQPTQINPCDTPH